MDKIMLNISGYATVAMFIVWLVFKIINSVKVSKSQKKSLYRDIKRREGKKKLYKVLLIAGIVTGAVSVLYAFGIVVLLICSGLEQLRSIGSPSMEMPYSNFLGKWFDIFGYVGAIIFLCGFIFMIRDVILNCVCVKKLKNSTGIIE